MDGEEPELDYTFEKKPLKVSEREIACGKQNTAITAHLHLTTYYAEEKELNSSCNWIVQMWLKRLRVRGWMTDC